MLPKWIRWRHCAMNEVLRIQSLSKNYRKAKENIPVLHNLDFVISAGDKIAIQGSSGCGKTTLLHILGGLDFEYSGEVFLRNICLKHENEKTRARVRNHS